MIRVLNTRRHPGKQALPRGDRQSSKRSLGADKDSQADQNALTGTNILNLNVNDSLGQDDSDQVRRGDLLAQGKLDIN